MSMLYVLIADLSDEEEDEEPFDKQKFEGVFSSLQMVETYIHECINEEVVLEWQPIVSFEHIPVLQTADYKVYIVHLDEGSWRSFQRLMGQVIKETAPEDEMNLYSKLELERLELIFATALGLTVDEFNARYSEVES